MSNIKYLNDKLRSLKNTQKITKTMKMVSANKLRKAHQAQARAKLYARHLKALTHRVAQAVHVSSHELIEPHASVKNILIVVFTSDKGLCGGFNNNTIKGVERWMAANASNYERITLYFCGQRGFKYFSGNPYAGKHYEGITVCPDFMAAERLGEDLQEVFLDNTFDEVYLAYNEFHNPLSQKPIFEKILPVDPRVLTESLKKDTEEIEASSQISSEHEGRDDAYLSKKPRAYLFEPASSTVLSFLIPHFLFFKIYFVLLENAAGEYGARMTAMDSATRNCGDLIESNTLKRNRLRQSAITTELIEIVAGAEALQ